MRTWRTAEAAQRSDFVSFFLLGVSRTAGTTPELAAPYHFCVLAAGSTGPNSIDLMIPCISPIHGAMEPRLARAVLCVVILCHGCASSGVIRGTLSTQAPTASAMPPEANGVGTTAVRSPMADAVVYLDETYSRRELRIPAAPGSPRLDPGGEAFRPRIFVDPVGTSVEFANQDTLFHDTFSVSPAKPFDLGRYGRGKSRRVTFDKP